MTAHHEQSGSALILAIAFILAMGLGITALLSFLYAGMNATTVVREQGGDLYAVDAAVEATIARLRVDKTLGIAGAPCGPFVETVDGREVTVECTPQGVSRQGPGAGSGFPAGALVALGTAPGDGIRISTGGAVGTLSVEGAVLSNGPLTMQRGNLVVTGAVRAASCGGTGTITAVPTTDLDCAAGSPAVRPHPEPPLPVAAAPAAAAAPTGPVCNGEVIPAGTYTSAATWDALVGSCAGTLRFQGVYFLDFTDTIVCNGQARAQWCLDDQNTTFLAGVDDATDATCTGTTGATFILGGSTTVRVLDGTANLCPLQAQPSDPAISVYASATSPWGAWTCGCTVLEDDRPQTTFTMRGTIYTPDAHVRLRPLNQARLGVTRGIVARSIEMVVPTIQDPSSFVIALESGIATADGLVELVAKLDGRARLTTRVLLPEGDGSLPTAVTVADWTVE